MEEVAVAPLGQLLLAFFYFVDSISGQICECFFFPGGPGNFDAVNAVAIAEAEMNAKVGLGKIAAAAHHFARLNEITRDCLDAPVQGEAVAPGSFQFETDPVIRRAALRLEDHRLPL